ncbi:MAG: right-handed parallel beta-helix repeat-containing protein [Anaerolineales bacterium]|jgi:parallel beta-helix repeat protein
MRTNTLNQVIRSVLWSAFLLAALVACAQAPSKEAIVQNSQPQETSNPTVAPATTTAESALPRVLYVDDYGADPYDDQADSQAIQKALGALQSGETLLFTSDEGDGDYTGYLIDQTLFIVLRTSKNGVTLGSTNPQLPARLLATEDLLGFVIRLYSRSLFGEPALLDNITLRDLYIDAGREVRICAGYDQVGNGVDDNWGSWVTGECTFEDDPWCHPGGISLPGAVDFFDYDQDYESAPQAWTTGLTVDNLTITNVECGTALGISGAESSITNTTIDTAGEHTHVSGCQTTDSDGEMSRWSDGITFDGTAMTVEGNTIINASDVGIVFFGGKDTHIRNNTVISSEGNYGAFAGIAIHTWGFGDISGSEVVRNTVINESDETCGGIHAGINIGTHMWNAGCSGAAGAGTVGNPGTCSENPGPPQGTLCIVDELCQIWAHIPPGESFTLAGNSVTGAHINYLIEGLDVQGDLKIEDNQSETPRETCWHAAKYGCDNQSFQRTWGPLDFVAHHPSISGWTDQIVHCEW